MAYCPFLLNQPMSVPDDRHASASRIFVTSISRISISLLAKYVAVVEYRPIVRKYCISVAVFHFWPLLTHLLRLQSSTQDWKS